SADLYAMGCIMTTLLQLHPPFKAASALDTMAKHMFTQVPPLKRPPDAEPVPPLLDKLRVDLLAKQPERRPKSAAEAKARLLEAMSREAQDKRLPARKGDEPGGDRLERAPVWEKAAEKSEPTARLSIAAREVALLHAAPEGERIPPECATGLAMQNIEVVEIQSAAEVIGRDLPVVILDVGSDLDQARARLAELAKVAPRARAVVCAANLSAERISDLVVVGAADVVRYPVTPDALGRKLE